MRHPELLANTTQAKALFAQAQGLIMVNPGHRSTDVFAILLSPSQASFYPFSNDVPLELSHCTDDGIRSESYWNLFLNATPARSEAASP